MIQVTPTSKNSHNFRPISITPKPLHLGDIRVVEFKATTMRSFIETLSDSISEIIAATGETHSLRLSDYHLLKTVMDNEILSEYDRKSAQRALHLVRRGRISLVDDLSEGFMTAAA